jgi:sialate O-acetylesterase
MDAGKDVYTERMKQLVAATRSDLRQPSLPWVIVQIARFTTDAPLGAGWNYVQEQERQLPNKIKNLETVAAIDLPLDDGIHIGALGFPRLGVRLARMADRLVYGNKKESKSPQLKEVILNYSTITSKGNMGPSIDVVFENVVGGLQAPGEPLGFALVTPEGVVWPCWYKTTLIGNVARLHLDRLPPEGTKLHYGYGVMPICNITDGRDLALPVFGPQPLIKQKAYLPYVTMWKVTDVVATPSASMAGLACPDFETLPSTIKTYPDGFINEHGSWLDKSGQAYFSNQLELPEPMTLQFVMSYDGPFRLWVDDKPTFTDIEGLKIRTPDMSQKIVKLKAGTHRVTIAMDINNGVAWGFVLRFMRLDVTKAQIKADSYLRPTYSA